MSDVLKGRPKGPNLTTGAIDAVFSVHPTPITIEDLEIGQNISPSHAEWIIDAMGCFNLGTGKLFPQFDPRFRKDNSPFCDKCCYGPKGSATMCPQYPFPQKSEIPLPESLTEQRKPSLLQIFINRELVSPSIWRNSIFIAQRERLGLDLVSTQYPQDCYVVGDDIIITSDGYDLFNPAGYPVVINNKLFQGGIYAFGQDTVFCALNEVSDNDAKLVASAFPTRQVYFVPTPERLGLVRRRRVLSHLDQYMGGALATYDGTYVIPIDASYLAASNFAEHNQDGKFKFFPVSPSLLDGMRGHHLLNYVLAPSGRTYLCPQMLELLKRADRNLHIDWRQIVKLPSSVPVNNIKAGLKCCINFV